MIPLRIGDQVLLYDSKSGQAHTAEAVEEANLGMLNLTMPDLELTHLDWNTSAVYLQNETDGHLTMNEFWSTLASQSEILEALEIKANLNESLDVTAERISRALVAKGLWSLKWYKFFQIWVAITALTVNLYAGMRIYERCKGWKKPPLTIRGARGRRKGRRRNQEGSVRSAGRLEEQSLSSNTDRQSRGARTENESPEVSPGTTSRRRRHTGANDNEPAAFPLLRDGAERRSTLERYASIPDAEPWSPTIGRGISLNTDQATEEDKYRVRDDRRVKRKTKEPLGLLTAERSTWRRDNPLYDIEMTTLDGGAHGSRRPSERRPLPALPISAEGEEPLPARIRSKSASAVRETTPPTTEDEDGSTADLELHRSGRSRAQKGHTGLQPNQSVRSKTRTTTKSRGVGTTELTAIQEDSDMETEQKVRIIESGDLRAGSSPLTWVIVSKGGAGVSSLALIDTGSMISMVTPKLVQRLGLEVDTSARPSSLTGISGESLVVSGSVTCDIQLQREGVARTWKFLVMEMNTHPVLLGADFLNEVGSLSFDFRQHKVFYGEKNQPKPMQYDVRSVEEVILPPRCRRITVGRIVGQNNQPMCHGAHCLVESEVGRMDLPLRGESCLDRVDAGRVRVLVTNESLSPQTVKKGTRIASAVRVHESETFTADDLQAPTRERGTSEKQQCILAVVEHACRSELQEMIFDHPDLKEKDKDRIRQALLDNIQAFSQHPNDIGAVDRSVIEHHIQLRPGAEPVRARNYPIPLAMKPVVDEEIKKLLESGTVKHADGAWAHPIVLVKQRSKTRMCLDLRALNSMSIPCTIPLPRITEIVAEMSGAKFITTIDLASAYHAVGLSAASQQMTQFSWNNMSYQYSRMPFGLHSAPSVLQRLMQSVLAGVGDSHVHIYLDDIIIAHEDLDSHLVKLRQVLERLVQFNLKCRLSKCHFSSNSATFLGYQLSSSGCGKLEDNVTKIRLFPRPNTRKKVRSFLGLGNFYRRFVKDYARIAKPLTNLTSSKSPFKWTDECTESFERLREALAEDIILKYPNMQESFHLTTDASDISIGAVLHQKEGSGLRPVAYFSQTLNTCQSTAWTTVDREAFAIYSAVEHWREYLYQTPFWIYTDNKPASVLFSVDNTKLPASSRILKWRLLLQCYNYKVRYVPGRSNAAADWFSRLDTQETASSEDHDVIPVLSCRRTSAEEDAAGDDSGLDWLQEQELDTDYKQIIVQLRAGNPVKDYSLGTQGLFRLVKHGRTDQQRRICVPRRWREKIVSECHDVCISGAHLGSAKTKQRIETKYYWRGITQTVHAYVDSCLVCFHAKYPYRRFVQPLQPYESPSPFKHISIDVVGPLATDRHRHQYILTCVCLHSGYLVAEPMRNTRAGTIARLFVDRIVSKHGAPSSLLSDRGSVFLGRIMGEVNKCLEVNHIKTAPYHPSANGACERSHRTLMAAVRAYVDTDHRTWSEYLHLLVFAMNTAFSASRIESPFFILYGRDAVWPSVVPPSVLDAVSEQQDLEDDGEFPYRMQERMTKIWEVVSETLKVKRGSQKLAFDKQCGKRPDIRLGDRVQILVAAFPPKRCRKLMHRSIGPYRVVGRSTNCALVRPVSRPLLAGSWINLSRVRLTYSRHVPFCTDELEWLSLQSDEEYERMIAEGDQGRTENSPAEGRPPTDEETVPPGTPDGHRDRMDRGSPRRNRGPLDHVVHEEEKDEGTPRYNLRPRARM